MLLRAYTLHDVKALTYSPPFYQSNDALAIRMLDDLVNDMNTSVGRHPADYKLYCVGTYDDGTGALKPLEIPEHITDAINLVMPKPSAMHNNLRKE
ncbi:nonstructural protein [Blackfly microvirus SF02]|uniref:Nonstructural protein n=1 Tax=Blackfly microvirus SF02 TaxID=2576452 RepID=A0A4P8PK50_9VIRU|nr:nonstructural protein [Blackfly microvirus SF02]